MGLISKRNLTNSCIWKTQDVAGKGGGGRMRLEIRGDGLWEWDEKKRILRRIQRRRRGGKKRFGVLGIEITF